MDNSANKLTAADYEEAGRNQPLFSKCPSLSEEQKRTKFIRKKDPITQKFKRIKTDGLRRPSYYSDTGKVLE